MPAAPIPSGGRRHSPPVRLARLGIGILLALLLVIVGASYLVVPAVVARVLPDAVSSTLNARLEVDSISFDPFLLQLTLQDVRLVGPLTDAVIEPDTLLAAPRVEVFLDPASVLGTPILDLVIGSPELNLVRAADGRFELATLVTPATAPETAAAESAAQSAGFELDLKINGGRIIVHDHQIAAGATLDITAIDLDLQRLEDMNREAGAGLTLSASLDDARLSANGALTQSATTGMGVDLGIDIRSLALALGAPWVSALTPVRNLRGNFTASLRLAYSAGDIGVVGTDLSIDDIGAQVPESGPERTAASITAGSIKLKRFEWSSRTGATSIDGLQLSGARVSAEFDATATADAEPEAAPEAAPTTAPGAGPSPSVTLSSLEIVDFDADLTDISVAARPIIQIRNLEVSAGPLQWPAAPTPAAEAPFRVAFGLWEGGTLTVEGSATPGWAQLQANVTLQDLDLAPMAPWVLARTRATLRQGILSAELSIAVRNGLRAEGSLEGSAIRMSDADGVPFVTSGDVVIDGLRLDTEPRTVAIERISVTAPSGRYARFRDGSSNLGRLQAPTTAPLIEAVLEAPSDDAPPAADNSEEPAWRWGIEHIDVSEGAMNFVDENLALPFAATIEDMEGTLYNFGTLQTGPARVAIDGRIPPIGLMHLDLQLSQPDPLQHAVLDLQFEHLALDRFSPYAASFVGYEIADGQLDMSLAVDIAAGQLDADNNLILDGIELGARVPSPNASGAPVELALALLRDSQNRIELSVPVSGDLTDPSFDLTPAMARATRKVMTSVVAAPFRVLGMLTPGRAQVSSAGFDFGSAVLEEAEREQVGTLADALQRRPALTLVLRPAHAGRPDLDGLRLAALDARLAQIGADRAAALRQLAGQRIGAEAITALEVQYGDSPTAAASVSAELEGALLTQIEVSESALPTLAEARISAIIAALEAEGLDRSRIRVSPDVEEIAPEATRFQIHFELSTAADRDIP